MKDDEKQAQEVINAFESFISEIRSITKRLNGRQSVTQEEKLELQGLLKELKDRIRRAAKTGTVSGLNTKKTPYEEIYFGPALEQA